MPTPTWASHFGARWGREVSVITNGFDATLDSLPPPDRPTVTHLGTYVPARQSLAPLWEAVIRYVSDGSRQSPLIRFVGDLPADGRAELSAAGIADLVEETGFVSHDDAMRSLASSTLLIAGGDTGRDVLARGWVPAKLFEYLATSLPILYVGDRAGDAAKMLARQAGCHVVPRGDAGALDAALEAGLSGGSHQRDVGGLRRRAGAQALANLLDRAVSRTRATQAPAEVGRRG
jgi:hypothetical protein